eukprot:403333609
MRNNIKSPKKDQHHNEDDENQEDFSIFDGQKICMKKNCQNKEHYHPQKNVKYPQFVEDQQIEALRDVGQDTPFPYPLLNDEMNKGYLKDRFDQKFSKEGRLSMDKKVVVTEVGLDHWLAQNFNLSIDQMPPYRPHNIPQDFNNLSYGNIKEPSLNQRKAQIIQKSILQRAKSQEGGNRQFIKNAFLKQKNQIQKLPAFQEYQRPVKDIRNRIQSETLGFLGKNEIENTALNLSSFLKNMNSSHQHCFFNKSKIIDLLLESAQKSMNKSGISFIGDKHSQGYNTQTTDNKSSNLADFIQRQKPNLSKNSHTDNLQSRNSIQDVSTLTAFKTKTLMNKTKVSEFKDEFNQVSRFKEAQQLTGILNRDYGLDVKLKKGTQESNQIIENFTNTTTQFNKAQFIKNKRKDHEQSVQQAINEEERQHHMKLQKILLDLENDLEEPNNNFKEELEIHLQEFKLDFQKMQQRINDMNNPQFWLQKAIQKSQSDSIESSIDYYKQGLRLNPTSEILIYNLACQYHKIHKYMNCIRWLEHSLVIKPRWTDAYYGLSLTYFKLGQYEKAAEEVQRAVECFRKNESLSDIDNMIYLKAMCYKNTKNFIKSQRDYNSLQLKFNQNNGKDLIKYIFGILLLPLQEDRKIQADYIENYYELANFYTKQDNCPEIKQSILQFQNQLTKQLDMKQFGRNILEHIMNKSFFKRFQTNEMEEYLSKASVERFQKDDLVFLNNRVGVVLNGSIMVRSHAQDLMKPMTMCKAIEGYILGYDEIDEKLTTHSQTWLIVQEPTEVVFFRTKSFHKLWRHQKLQTDKQIVIAKLQKNDFFGSLDQQSLHTLVYEGIQERHYQPGQLIVSQSQRSVLNYKYLQLFQSQQSKLKKDIENKKVLERGDSTIIQSDYMAVMNALKPKRQPTLSKSTFGQPDQIHLKDELSLDGSEFSEEPQTQTIIVDKNKGRTSPSKRIKKSTINLRNAFDNIQVDNLPEEIMDKLFINYLMEKLLANLNFSSNQALNILEIYLQGKEVQLAISSITKFSKNQQPKSL